jgi:hypothetical protein
MDLKIFAINLTTVMFGLVFWQASNDGVIPSRVRQLSKSLHLVVLWLDRLRSDIWPTFLAERKCTGLN